MILNLIKDKNYGIKVYRVIGVDMYLCPIYYLLKIIKLRKKFIYLYF